MAEVKHNQNSFQLQFPLILSAAEGQKYINQSILKFQSFTPNFSPRQRLSSHTSQTLENLHKGRYLREELH